MELYNIYIANCELAMSFSYMILRIYNACIRHMYTYLLHAVSLKSECVMWYISGESVLRLSVIMLGLRCSSQMDPRSYHQSFLKSHTMHRGRSRRHLGGALIFKHPKPSKKVELK